MYHSVVDKTTESALGQITLKHIHWSAPEIVEFHLIRLFGFLICFEKSSSTEETVELGPPPPFFCHLEQNHHCQVAILSTIRSPVNAHPCFTESCTWTLHSLFSFSGSSFLASLKLHLTSLLFSPWLPLSVSLCLFVLVVPRQRPTIVTATMLGMRCSSRDGTITLGAWVPRRHSM